MLTATAIIIVDSATGLLLGGLLLGLLQVIEIAFVKKKYKKVYWFSGRFWIGVAVCFYAFFFGGTAIGQVLAFMGLMYSPVVEWNAKQKKMKKKKKTRSRNGRRRLSQPIRHNRIP